MDSREQTQLEPFAELAGSAYRFGYRVVGTIDNVSTIEVPAPIVEQQVMMSASLAARIDPDGTVISQISMSSFHDITPSTSSKAVPIDDLLQKAVSAENLRLEETKIVDLRILLKRLERSVSLVKEAIDQMAAGSSSISS
jgi:hypothetical protein